MTRMAGAFIPFCGVITIISIVFIGITPELIAGVKMTVEPKGEPAWFVQDDPFVLTCIVEGATDDNVVWMKNAAPVDPQYTSMSKDSTALVPKTILTYRKEQATDDDDGAYLCSYDTLDLDISKRATVVTVTTRNANMTQGYQTTLTCEVEPYNEMCSITWLKGGVPLIKIPELDGKLTFGTHNTTVAISNTQLSDVGVYTCLIQFNRDTNIEQTFTRILGIKGKPHVVPSEVDKLKIITNMSITLVCPVKAYPEAEVFWRRGDDILQATYHYYMTSYNGVPDSRLKVLNPREDDFGKYVCIMENSMGKSEYTIDVKDPNEPLGGGAGPSARAGFVTMTLGLFITAVHRMITSS